jgi:hypothetical protein
MPNRVKLLLAALFTAGVGIFVALAFIGGGGGDCPVPDGIDEVLPPCNTAVLGQTQIGVRVDTGYTADLALNGVPIPRDQLTSGGQTPVDESDNPVGVAQTDFLFFPPTEGELSLQPRNSVTVTYWRLVDGEDESRSFTWFFTAA